DDVAGELLGAAHVKHGDDVRVVEASNRARFGQIGFGIGDLGDESGVRHLDGDASLQLVVVGQVDEAEAAPAQNPLDPVAAYLGRAVAGNHGRGRECSHGVGQPAGIETGEAAEIVVGPRVRAPLAAVFDVQPDQLV